MCVCLPITPPLFTYFFFTFNIYTYIQEILFDLIYYYCFFLIFLEWNVDDAKTELMLILYDNKINEKNYAMLLSISDTSRAEVKKKSIRPTWDVRMLDKKNLSISILIWQTSDVFPDTHQDVLSASRQQKLCLVVFDLLF